MQLPINLLPGTWGVSRGSGWIGDTVRKAEEEMSKSERFPDGDHEASWAGHAFVYVGNHCVNGITQPAIIEAEWPKVRLSSAFAHSDAIWAINQPITGMQRRAGVETCMRMIGTSYDVVAFAYFLMKLAHVALSKDLRPLFVDTARTGPICSGIVVRELIAMNYNIGELRTAATQDPDFVCPADLLRWGLDNNWMNRHPYAK